MLAFINENRSACGWARGLMRGGYFYEGKGGGTDVGWVGIRVVLPGEGVVVLDCGGRRD